MKGGKKKRRYRVIVAIIVMVWILVPVMPEAASYDPNAAVQWAYQNYNSSSELCAGFVSKCVQNGGIGISKYTTVGKLATALSENGFTPMQLTAAKAGVYKYSANSSKISNGDVLIWHCPSGYWNGKKTVYWLHAALVTGHSSKDQILVTQTNGAVKDSTADYYYWNKSTQKPICDYVVYCYHYTGKKSVAAPSISVSNISGGKSVSISAASGTTAYYSLNGSAYKKYTSPFTVTESGSYTVKAYVLDSSNTASTYTSKVFSVSKAARPMIASTKSGSKINITLSGSTTGSTIYYSINNGNWYTYSNSITLSSTSTVRAYAKAAGYAVSDTATGTFTIEKPAAPVVNLSGTADKVGIGSSVMLAWNRIENADKYQLEICNPDGTSTTNELQGTTAAVKVTETGKYTFQVTAINACGSTEGNQISVTVMPDVTVQFLDDEGNALSQIYTIPYGGSVAAPKAPEKEGYAFQRWDGSYENVTENTQVKAVFDILTFRVIFKDSDGTILSSQKINWNEAAKEPDMTGKAPEVGYMFSGWSVDQDSDWKDFRQVRGDMILYATYAWANPDLPVLIQDFAVSCEYNSAGQYYAATMNLICSPGEDIKGRAILAIKTDKGTTLAVVTQDITLKAGDKKVPLSMTLNSSCEGTKAEVYVIGLDENGKTAGTYANMVDTEVTREDYYTAWSDWSTEEPESAENVQVESRVLYRYNTRSTATSTTSKTMTGYTYTGTTSKTGSWSSWQDSAISAVNTEALLREVQTQQVVTATYYTYGHYCTGNVTGAKYQTSSSNNTSNSTFNANCTYHSLGKFISTSSLFTPWSDGVGYKYIPSGSTSYYRCSNTCYRWYRMSTSKTYKTQYRYRDTTYVHSFEKISGFTNWSETEPEAGTYYQKETQVQYRYRTKANTGDGANVTEDSNEILLSGNIQADGDLTGRKATVLVYKKTNTDPTQSQIEYVDQITIGENNSYAITVLPRENPSGDTGDFVVSLAIEGSTRLINAEVIYAPKPSYTVTFSCEGQIISTQTIEENGNADIPVAEEIEGKRFVRWDTAVSNVTRDLSVEAVYEDSRNVVIYVDSLNGVVEMEYAGYGSPVVKDLPEAPEGYICKGWDAELVTGDMIIHAQYEKIICNVVFANPEGESIWEQEVPYGESAVAPSLDNISAPAGTSVQGWSQETNWRYVTENMVVYPVVVYAETASEPYLCVNPADPDQILLQCDTPDAQIYYTVDGSEPDRDSASAQIYTASFSVSEGTVVKAVAVADGMNYSATAVLQIMEDYDDSTDVTGISMDEESTGQAALPGKGATVIQNNVKYQVLDSTASTVAVIAVSDRKITTAEIPAAVNVQGVTMKVTKIDDGAFENCTSLTTVTIGSNVTSLGKQAFSGCKNLKTIKGADGVTTVGSKAFYNCSKLTQVGNKKNIISLSKVQTIGSYGFCGCKSIKKVNLTSTALTKIDAFAFQNCTALTSVAVKSVKLSTIGKKAFYGDRKLGLVTLKTTKLKKVGKNAFKNIKTKAKIKVPAKKAAVYKKMMKSSGIGKKVMIGS